jgi:hypothetical protein
MNFASAAEHATAIFELTFYRRSINNSPGDWQFHQTNDYIGGSGRCDHPRQLMRQLARRAFLFVVAR